MLRTIAVVVMIRFVGNVFAGPVDATIRFFDQHLVATSLASMALVAGWMLWERYSSDPSAEVDRRELTNSG